MASFYGRIYGRNTTGHTACKGIFDGLLGSNTGRVGILGQVANHFGVVETNGRGMLHLHALVWLTGNLGFGTLRARVLRDKSFASRMISLLGEYHRA